MDLKNFGDEAILSVLVEHLKKIGVDITVFSLILILLQNVQG